MVLFISSSPHHILNKTILVSIDILVYIIDVNSVKISSIPIKYFDLFTKKGANA